MRTVWWRRVHPGTPSSAKFGARPRFVAQAAAIARGHRPPESGGNCKLHLLCSKRRGTRRGAVSTGAHTTTMPHQRRTTWLLGWAMATSICCRSCSIRKETQATGPRASPWGARCTRRVAAARLDIAASPGRRRRSRRPRLPQVVRIDRSGKTRRLYLRRRDLIRQFDLLPRDLRRIDPTLSVTRRGATRQPPVCAPGPLSALFTS